MKTIILPTDLHKKSSDPDIIHFSYHLELSRKTAPEMRRSHAKPAVDLGIILGALKRLGDGFIIEKLVYCLYDSLVSGETLWDANTGLFIYKDDRDNPIKICKTAEDIKYVLTMSSFFYDIVELERCSSYYHYFIEDTVPIPYKTHKRDKTCRYYNSFAIGKLNQLISEASEVLPEKIIKKTEKKGWINMGKSKKKCKKYIKGAATAALELKQLMEAISSAPEFKDADDVTNIVFKHKNGRIVLKNLKNKNKK